jgi:hypothetical protein
MIFKERNNVKAEVTFTGGDPIIYIQPLALDKMALYVQGCDKEIGWLGRVERADNCFLIHDVYLFKQEVNATTCEISPEGLSDFAMDVLTNQGNAGMDIVNNLRLWGHSHVNMAVSPSGQDDTQILTFKEGNPWFIRVIANKSGEMEFSVYDFEQGIKFKNVKWMEYRATQAELEEVIKAEIAEKVTTKVYASAKNTWSKDSGKVVTYGRGNQKSYLDYDTDGYTRLTGYKYDEYEDETFTSGGKTVAEHLIDCNFLKAELIAISSCATLQEATKLIEKTDVWNKYNSLDIMNIWDYAQNTYPQ